MIDYPRDTDVAWLASDDAGQVAVFTTGGHGPVPHAVLEAVPDLLEAERWITDLPLTSTAEVLIKLPRPDDFVGWAERGLFAFDWRDTHRLIRAAVNAYELVARPTRPIQLAQLPARVADAAAVLRLPGASFAAGLQIDVRRFAPCIERA